MRNPLLVVALLSVLMLSVVPARAASGDLASAQAVLDRFAAAWSKGASTDVAALLHSDYRHVPASGDAHAWDRDAEVRLAASIAEQPREVSVSIEVHRVRRESDGRWVAFADLRSEVVLVPGDQPASQEAHFRFVLERDVTNAWKIREQRAVAAATPETGPE